MPTSHPIIITDELQQALDAIEELERRYVLLIENTNISPDEWDMRKGVALHTATAVGEYALSVRLLCSNYKGNTSEPLLRAMQEGSITLKYLLGKDGNARVLAMYAANVDSMAASIEKVVEYLVSHNIDGFAGRTLDEVRQTIINNRTYAEGYRQELAALNDDEFEGSLGYPRLATRAKRIDEGTEAEPRRTEEFGYLVTYNLWSGGTHLGLDALQSWAQQANTQIDINANETAESNQRVAFSVFSLAGDVFTLALTELGYGDEEFANWVNETAERLRNNTTEA